MDKSGEVSGQVGQRDIDVIAGSGEAANSVRNYPWHDSPLGPVELWPSTLVATVNLVLNSATAAAVYWGPDLIYIGNDASTRLTGKTTAGSLGLPAPALWGQRWSQMEPRFAAVLACGASFNGEELPLLSPRHGRTGEAFLKISLSPIYHQGQLAGVFRTLEDSTEQVLAMRHLADANERLNMALTAGNCLGVWDWHIQSGLVYADRNAATLYGIDPAAAAAGVPHLLFEQALHPDDVQGLTDAILACITTATNYTADYRVRRADGTYRWVRSMGRCVLDEQGHPIRVTGLKLDVTDEKPAVQASTPTSTPTSTQPAPETSTSEWDKVPDPLRTLLQATVLRIVEHPAQIKLTVLPAGDAMQVTVHVAAPDLGKVLGKEGRTIRSVRTLLLAINGGSAHRYSIDVKAL